MPAASCSVALAGRRREAQVALGAQVVQHGPRRGDGAARLRPQHARGAVEAAQPVVGDERLVATEVLGSVEDHRRALGGVAELVEVDGDRRDAVDPEVPGCDGVAEQLQVGERDTAHARVDVAADASLGGDGRHLLDRVHHALGVLRRRGHDQGRVGVDRGSHRRGIGSPVVADRHAHAGDAEVGGALLEGRVGAGRQHHVRLRDAALGPGPVAGGLDGHQDALGPAGRQEPRRLRPAPQPARHHVEDVGLQHLQAGEGVGVERVLAHEPGVGLGLEGQDLVAGVVGEGEGAAVPPAHVVGPHRLQPGQHLGGGESLGGQRHSGAG